MLWNYASYGLAADQTRMQELGRMGWRVLGSFISGAFGGAVYAWHEATAQVRLRWRATNPGLRPVTRFTRNFDIETGVKEGRHIPWSFRGPLVEGKPLIVVQGVKRSALW